MGFWKVIVPLATLNMIINPSFELNTTSWAAIAGTISRSTSQARWGGACMQILPTVSAYDGAYYGTVNLQAGSTYTFSVWVHGTLGVSYRVYFATTAGVALGTPTTFVGLGKWSRVEVSYTEVSSTSRRVYVTKNNSVSVSAIYVDGAQVEALAAASTYCDGDQDGCAWASRAHASTSQRSGQSRAGGRVVNLDDYGFYVVESPGIGMPPVQHLAQQQAFFPGAIYQGTRVQARVFDLAADQVASSRGDLHAKRAQLIDALFASLGGEAQPVWLRYSGAVSAGSTGAEVETPVVYDSGLGFSGPNGYTEKQVVRLIGYDPFWYEVGEAAQALDVEDSITLRGVVGRVEGNWDPLGPPSSGGIVYALAADEQYLYVGGNFTNWDGIGDADYIVRYEKATGTWSALGTGMNGAVSGLALGPDGTLYAVGSFTTAGGGGANRAARWNGSAWSALGTGLSGPGYAVAVGFDGEVYVGGLFATAGGATVNNVAMWSGPGWSALGAGTNGQVNALAIGMDGALLAGGTFNTADGVTIYGVARWDGAAWSSLGSESHGTIYAIKVAQDGQVYIGESGATYRAARWNGSQWIALAPVPNGTVWSLGFDGQGRLWAGGAFTTAGGLAIADYTAVWDGSQWSQPDIDFPPSPLVQAVLADGENVYLGGQLSGTATASKTNTVNNPGSRLFFPVIQVKRAGGTLARIESVENYSNGRKLLLNYELADGETLTIDLRPGRRAVTSSYYGRVWRALQRGSDFANFCLLPGDNQVQVLVRTGGAPTLGATILWRNVFWSVDGAAGL